MVVCDRIRSAVDVDKYISVNIHIFLRHCTARFRIRGPRVNVKINLLRKVSDLLYNDSLTKQFYIIILLTVCNNQWRFEIKHEIQYGQVQFTKL